METFLTDKQTTNLIHVLAAHNHRFRTRLTTAVQEQPVSLPRLIHDVIHDNGAPLELARIAQTGADVANWLFADIAGQPKEINAGVVVTQKFVQLQLWIVNLQTKENPAYNEWLQHMGKPFMDLTPNEQAPAYYLARNDLPVLAEAHGKRLPDTMPTIEPITGFKLGVRKGLHLGSRHGKYLAQEKYWSRACQLCDVTFSMR